MPLLDHFHPPIHPRHHWESFHSNWATRLADALNDKWLPPEFLAEEYTPIGAHLEIDVATYDLTPQHDNSQTSDEAPSTVRARPAVWTPPAAPLCMPSVIPDNFEVRVYASSGGNRLVAAIELVSPANKDRDDHRRAFAVQCAHYLYQGISLIVVDIVTNRRVNLHNETMRLMEADAQMDMPPETYLYAVAYRPVVRGEKTEIDVWPERLTLGAAK